MMLAAYQKHNRRLGSPRLEKAYDEGRRGQPENAGQYVSAAGLKFDRELEMFAKGELPKGHVFKLGKPGAILVKTGFPEGQKIELSVKKLEEKSQAPHQTYPAYPVLSTKASKEKKQ